MSYYLFYQKNKMYRGMHKMSTINKYKKIILNLQNKGYKIILNYQRH